MALAASVFRRCMVKEAKPLAALYSSEAKNSGAHGPTAGREFFGLFAMRRIKKHWELMPLFIIIGGAVVGLGSYIVYASQTRDDVRFFSKPNYEKTDLLNPKKRKLAVFDQEYRPMNEIAEAYKGMEESKSK